MGSRPWLPSGDQKQSMLVFARWLCPHSGHHLDVHVSGVLTVFVLLLLLLLLARLEPCGSHILSAFGSGLLLCSSVLREHVRLILVAASSPPPRSPLSLPAGLCGGLLLLYN
jgi:hypothetical protein